MHSALGLGRLETQTDYYSYVNFLPSLYIRAHLSYRITSIYLVKGFSLGIQLYRHLWNIRMFYNLKVFHFPEDGRELQRKDVNDFVMLQEVAVLQTSSHSFKLPSGKILQLLHWTSCLRCQADPPNASNSRQSAHFSLCY